MFPEFVESTNDMTKMDITVDVVDLCTDTQKFFIAKDMSISPAWQQVSDDTKETLKDWEGVVTSFNLVVLMMNF